MSTDSVWQLATARSGELGNWHPPSMALLWRFLGMGPDFGPEPMLLLQMTLYWISLFSISRHFFEKSRIRWQALALIGFFPVFFLHSGIIWKDVQMAVALLAAFALLTSTRIGFLKVLLICLCLLYATTVRHNAAAACLPLWALLLTHKFSLKPLHASFLATVLTVSTFLFANYAVDHFGEAKESYPVQQILVHDIAAISLQKKLNLLPNYLDPNRTRTPEHFRKLYTPREVVPLFCCDGADFRLHITHNKDHFLSLIPAWTSAVTTYPGAYLTHRWKSFAQLLGFNKTACLPFYYGIGANDMGLALKAKPIRDGLFRLSDAIKNSFLFRAWPFVLLLLVQLFCFRRLSPSLQCLNLSGLLYLLPYFFVATTCDFRMSLWSAMAAWTGSLILWYPALSCRDLVPEKWTPS